MSNEKGYKHGQTERIAISISRADVVFVTFSVHLTLRLFIIIIKKTSEVSKGYTQNSHMKLSQHSADT